MDIFDIFSPRPQQTIKIENECNSYESITSKDYNCYLRICICPRLIKMNRNKIEAYNWHAIMSYLAKLTFMIFYMLRSFTKHFLLLISIFRKPHILQLMLKEVLSISTPQCKKKNQTKAICQIDLSLLLYCILYRKFLKYLQLLEELWWIEKKAPFMQNENCFLLTTYVSRSSFTFWICVVNVFYQLSFIICSTL